MKVKWGKRSGPGCFQAFTVWGSLHTGLLSHGRWVWAVLSAWISPLHARTPEDLASFLKPNSASQPAKPGLPSSSLGSSAATARSASQRKTAHLWPQSWGEE